MHRWAIRLYAVLVAGAATFMITTPAAAQFTVRPISDPATGERYVIEASAGFWNPTADMTIASESLGIAGTVIDLKKDLGLTDHRFREIHLVLRPARKHKFRFQYIPIDYKQSSTVSRDIVFNGQRYRGGLQVDSLLKWNAYRIGYEYDFIVRDRGFGGFILDLKHTDVKAALDSAIVSESIRAQAPIPAIGGIFRVYVVPNISITGEVTGFKLPEKVVEDAKAHYFDVDFYGTLNFTNHIGTQVGYRSFDVGYVVDTDTGNFKLRGLYFGVVARY